jgi:hypothetical protein
MELPRPTLDEARAGLRAIVTVARAPGGIAPPARALIDAAQGFLLGTDLDVDRLDTIEPADLADVLPRRGMRRQLVQGMILVSMASGASAPEQARSVARFAEELGVTTPALRALQHLASQELVLYRLCVLRNGHMPDMLRAQYAKHGLTGVAKALLGIGGYAEDPALAARFHALEQLPDRTLGRRLWCHYRDNGFSVPGEPGGFPEVGVYHDLSHVIGGYNATPEGETLVGAFIAGYRRRRPDHGFFTLLHALGDFGVEGWPMPAGTRTGAVGRVARQFLEAIERGAALSIDLSDGWDFWPHLHRPLDDVRALLGVPAKDEGGHRWDYD